MSSKKILVLGAGGREHALVWHLKKFSHTVECAPGSDGISQIAPCWKFSNTQELIAKIKAESFDLVIVGPEKYLAEGVVNELEKEGINVFGPRRESAELESDKAFAKDFCQRHGIPSSRSISIKTLEAFKSEITKFQPPYVLKASGLAAGKGVWIGENLSDAESFVRDALKSHPQVVIEDFLKGEELSFFALIDGDYFTILGAAQDHKRLLENDQGPNTGGMGAYSPVPILNAELQSKIISRVLRPTMSGLKSDGLYYRGFLFLGMMIVDGNPYLLEYNCRMGDPETQPLMMRLQTSLAQIIDSLKLGKPLKPELSPKVALNVVVAAKGYPDNPQQGFNMPGLDQIPEGCEIFHSGTKRQGSEWIAQGGRLFSVASLQHDLLACQQIVYPWIESLKFLDQVTYRRDIAVRAYTHLLRS